MRSPLNLQFLINIFLLFAACCQLHSSSDGKRPRFDVLLCGGEAATESIPGNAPVARGETRYRGAKCGAGMTECRPINVKMNRGSRKVRKLFEY